MKTRPGQADRDPSGGKSWSREEARHIACDCVLWFSPMKHSGTCFGAGSKRAETVGVYIFMYLYKLIVICAAW
jgi:hypothetical protein